MPPATGPRMVAACQNVEPQATELAKTSGGTSWGKIARLAGPLNERTTPSKASTAYMETVDTLPRKVMTISRAKHTAKPKSQSSRRFLRLKRSAACPESRKSKILG